MYTYTSEKINMKLNENTSCLNSFLKISRKQFSVRVLLLESKRIREWVRVWRLYSRRIDCISEWLNIWHWDNLALLLAFTFFPFLSFQCQNLTFLPPSHLTLCGYVWFYLFSKWIYLRLFVCLLRTLWPRTALICANECHKFYLLSAVKWNCRIRILFVISFFPCNSLLSTFAAVFFTPVLSPQYINGIVSHNKTYRNACVHLLLINFYTWFRLRIVSWLDSGSQTI